MSDERFLNTLGLAMRAGQLDLGEDATKKAIAGGKTAFVLIDASASGNAKKRIQDACAFRSVPLYEVPGGELGARTGRPGRMSAAVRKGKMADLLLSLLPEDGAGTERKEPPS